MTEPEVATQPPAVDGATPAAAAPPPVKVAQPSAHKPAPPKPVLQPPKPVVAGEDRTEPLKGIMKAMNKTM